MKRKHKKYSQVLCVTTRKQIVRHCHAAPSGDKAACVAVRNLALRRGKEMGGHIGPPYGRRNPLPFLYSLSSLIAAVLSQRER